MDAPTEHNPQPQTEPPTPPQDRPESPTQQPATDAAPGERISIADFLSDGSLPRLCAQLSSMTGVSIELRDSANRLVLPESGPRPWRVEDHPAPPPPDGADEFRLVVAQHRLGAIVLMPGEPTRGAGDRAHLRTTLALVARAASEVCEHVAETEHRIRELDVLYRLASLLARAQSVEKVLSAALDSALDVLGLDAGSIVVVPEVAQDAARARDTAGPDRRTPPPRAVRFEDAGEGDLQLLASRGLSDAWLNAPVPLSKDRVFDRLALGGEVVSVEDLRSDARVIIADMVLDENVRGFATAGLIFRDRALGAIRVYSRGPRRFTSSEKRLLQSIANQAAVAVEQARLLETQRVERRHQQQLRLASDVQRRMMPTDMPRLPGLDIAARYEPSLELAGDFYDAFEIGMGAELDGLAERKGLALVVGDVVGKGVPAALLMSAVRATLRALAERTADLAETIRTVNRAMCRDTLSNEFATLWYGVIDPGSLTLSYVAAGHDPPLIVRVPQHRPAAPPDMDELSTGGLVVGIDPSQRYQVATCDLAPGDVLLAYSDGLPDARNFQQQRFGKDRLRAALLDVLGAKPDANAAHIADSIMWQVRRFTGLAPRADDQTLLVVRVTGR